MDNLLLHVGFGNAVKINRILAVVNPGSSPVRKLKDEARQEKKIIDVTEGRRTRSILILDSGHLVLSSVQPDTITQRLTNLSKEERNPALKLDRLENDES
ncbi:MAG: DUF370 domain-containing protein [Desulfobulbaceae bacterium]|nr:DUF370 domain-containing protein [Desulfobulbaceae bacterium]